MNKRFFTLLVMLMTISFGAFAQLVSEVPVTGNFSSSKQYLLKTTSGNRYLSVDVVDGVGTRLILVPSIPQTLGALQRASWKLSVTQGAGEVAPTYVFTNVSNGIVLTLDSNNALETTGTNPGQAWDDKYDPNKSAIVTGEMSEWLATRTSITAGPTNFYWVTGSDDKVIVLASVTDNSTGTPVDVVVGKKISATTLATDGDKLEFTPFTTRGRIALGPNDLNTQLGAAGVLVNGEMTATMDNFFKMYIEPANTEESPMTHELQARAVKRWEIKYGTDNMLFYMSDANAAIYGNSFTNVPGAATSSWNAGDEGPAAFISMYPAGTSEDKDKQQGGNRLLPAVTEKDAEWYALYSKNTDAYVVVDTAYVPGTEQANNALIKLTTDKLYNSKDETRYRLPESYLFQFVYNAANNTVEVTSLGYAVKQTEALTTYEDNRVKTSTDLAAYYSMGAQTGTPAFSTNAYNTNPVLKNRIWPNGNYEAVGGSVVVTLMEPGGQAGVWDRVNLTHAQLNNEVVYTLGNTIENNFIVKLGISPQYATKRIPTGVYLLKVTGVNNSANANRVGKYLKMSLDGTFEYVEQAVRQNFMHMPSAHWVIETAGSTAFPSSTMTNREFDKGPDGLFLSGITYDGGANRFFFNISGDTLEYTKVTATDSYVGYKYIDEDNFNLNRYTFRYLHELAMDKPINTINDKDSAIWVDKNDQDIKFVIEKQLDDTYGFYKENLKSSIAQLKRAVYKIRVAQALNFDVVDRYVTYDPSNKKYYLTSDKELASEFFLKENNEVSDGNCYYTLLEANVITNLLKGKVTSAGAIDSGFSGDAVSMVADDEISHAVSSTGVVEGYFYSTKQRAIDENGLPYDKWQPQVIADITDDAAADVRAFLATYGLTFAQFEALQIAGNIIAVPATAGDYLAWRFVNEDYAYTKVSVDNNTLNLVNGIIADNASQEVVNSAFSIEKDDTRLYRHLGDEEGEVDDVNFVKFYRVNNPAAREYLYEDANSIYSTGKGMNFLGVESKGVEGNAPMIARYTSGTVMPQYLISVDEEFVPAEEVICPVCNGLDPNCDHSKYVREYIKGRFLVNLIDSVNYYGATTEKGRIFTWNNEYTRLAFVDARLQGDSLIIDSSVYTGNTNRPSVTSPNTYWSKDTINIAPNVHSPVLFSFRLIQDGSNDFYIESESWNSAKNNPWTGGIAPTTRGGWVKIQNGVPVVVNAPETEDYKGAEVFNIDLTDETPVSNDVISTSEVTVVADYGKVIVKGAAGKKVTIANVLGQTIVSDKAGSDDAEFAAPAGVVVVTVEGAPVAKALVK